MNAAALPARPSPPSIRLRRRSACRTRSRRRFSSSSPRWSRRRSSISSLIALGGDAELWPHLAAHVIPAAALNTVLLLAGVALVSMVAGVGTAWIVTAYDFPGRSIVIWLLPLPLAFPTYIVAYVYADLLGGVGPVQSSLRALFGWRSAADYWFPNVRSLGGAVLVMGFVLYPYVYLAARAMFQTQSVALIETARGLGATPVAARPRHRAAAGAAGDRGGRRAGAARNAERHRRQRISRRPDADALDLHHLAQPVEPARRGADRLRHAARGRGADRAGALRTAAAGLHRPRHAARPRAAHRRLPAASDGSRSRAACCRSALGFVVPLLHLAYEVIARGLLIGFDPAVSSATP